MGYSYYIPGADELLLAFYIQVVRCFCNAIYMYSSHLPSLCHGIMLYTQ